MSINNKCEAKGCPKEGTLKLGSPLWLCLEHRSNFSHELNESKD